MKQLHKVAYHNLLKLMQNYKQVIFNKVAVPYLFITEVNHCGVVNWVIYQVDFNLMYKL